MPNQRKIGKKLISGYVSRELKQDVRNVCKDLGVTETAYVEIVAIKELILHKRLNRAQVQKMADQARLTPDTIHYFKKTRLIK